MKKKYASSLMLVIFSTFFSFCLGEIYIRYKGRFDVDGNFYFRFRRLKPFKLPLKSIHTSVEMYLRESTSYIMYDSELGWTIRPNSESTNGLYKSNSYGIRSTPSEPSIDPVPGHLRIALIGDSFTHADDVPYEHTWGHLLELNLKERGIDSEVINFGVPGYGIDQAFLRWKKLGRRFSPNIVILGFVPADVRRNVNIFWPIRSPGAGLFFSKPRFVLSNDSIILVNSPTVQPTEIISILNNFDQSSLAKYEYYYYKPDYQERFWHNSKFFTFILDILSANRYKYKSKSGKDLKNKSGDFFDLDNEPSQLTLRIVEEFRKDVKDQGSKFIIVHLPWRAEFKKRLKGKKMPYSKLIKKLDDTFNVIHPEEEMLKVAKLNSINYLFAGRYSIKGNMVVPGHYSLKGNHIVADIITEYIMKLKTIQNNY